MYNMSDFKHEHTFAERYEESNRVLVKYPDRKPIICEKTKLHKDLPNIDRKKYLVPNDLTIGQFIFIIRKRLKLRPDEALYLSANNKIMASSTTIGQVYHNDKDPDGFLYLYYAKESVFG